MTAFDIVAAQFLVTVAPMAFDHRIFDEDGRPMIGECFVVWVTSPKGRRWQAVQSFSTYIEHTQDGPLCLGYNVAKAQARDLLERTAVALSSGAKLVSADWHEIDPAYGSPAYQAQGIEWERAQADRYAD